MKSPLLSITAVLLVCTSCAIPPRTDSPRMKGVEILYKAPMLALIIRDGSLSYTRQVDVTYTRPWNDVPESSRERTGGGIVSEQEVRSLLDTADGCGFFSLNDAYGAPGDERYYPYEISITRDSRKKIVIFRSNPSYAGAPPCFVALQEKITALAGR
jgi:hypothetical protein